MAAFVVNPGGAVHSVEDHRAEALYAEGFRPATAEEIAAWYAMQGLDVPADLTGQAGPAGVTDATSEHGGADQSGAGAGGRRRRR
jgi:hypothetical protein